MNPADLQKKIDTLRVEALRKKEWLVRLYRFHQINSAERVSSSSLILPITPSPSAEKAGFPVLSHSGNLPLFDEIRRKFIEKTGGRLAVIAGVGLAIPAGISHVELIFGSGDGDVE